MQEIELKAKNIMMLRTECHIGCPATHLHITKHIAAYQDRSVQLY